MKRLKPTFSKEIPHGDDRLRAVCDHCGFVDYVNPKIVAGVVASDASGRILLCRRAIEPRRGYWTLPAGFLETGESVEAGAAREAWEEACAALAIDALVGVYSIPRISQVQLFFRARLTSSVAPGPESLEVALVDWDAVPRDALAFPSVHWALDDWRAGLGSPAVTPAHRTADA